MMSKDVSDTVETMTRERKQCSFDVSELMELYLDGKEAVKLWKKACEIIEQDEVFNDGFARYFSPKPTLDHLIPLYLLTILIPSSYEFSRQESRERVFRKFAHLREVERNLTEPERLMLGSALDLHDRSLGMRLFVHRGLWMGTIRNQGSAEQQARWLDEADRLGKLILFSSFWY